MTESASNPDTSHETSFVGAPPEFGLVDVVEAFTAMRHEWRGQIREHRAVADSIRDAADAVRDLASKLPARTVEEDPDEVRKLAELVADVDHQLTRSVEAIESADEFRTRREDAKADDIRRYFDGMNWLTRWFARPLLTFVAERNRSQCQVPGNPAAEGLNLVVVRLRRTMKELGIERVETLGEAFDANTMNAIGTIESDEFPAGCVAEQLTPAYRWKGRLLRCADVRVAARQSTEETSPAGSE